MEFASMLTTESYTLLSILAVLMVILRGNSKIPNWIIQWIILVAALLLSFIQSKMFNIDVILNAFIATGVCLFGENAVCRKKSEKTLEEDDILNVLNEYKSTLENEKRDKVNMSEELVNLLNKNNESNNIK